LPLYEYQCPECGTFERMQKFSDPVLTACPTCESPVEKLLSAPAIQFKGSGWYVTDYAGKSSGKEAGDKEASGKEAGDKEASGKEAGKKKDGSSAKDKSAASEDRGAKPSASTTKGPDKK
jgi:putative FmdB family regulatory protein